MSLCFKKEVIARLLTFTVFFEVRRTGPPRFKIIAGLFGLEREFHPLRFGSKSGMSSKFAKQAGLEPATQAL
ncbi:hypothetical protein EG028_09060 [Chitinophaga barathri]|uniref:Uncharacterized protein n=1 Tax=Chitinophaga barathri TaxID=1647451 RepID=A0A3N4MD19_9BACT|nr:hypothetical protein EG028_09060 [Chitinophaga barathri]